MFTDILFDATEIAQGQVVVGYLSYSKESEVVWKHVEHSICNNLWDQIDANDEIKQGISGFLKFFSKNKNKSYLNTLYGPLGLPRRLLKPGETDDHKNIIPQSARRIIRAGDITFLSELDHAKPYIWVINDFGDLILGEDVFKDSKFQGHPTLTDGKPARIGGELNYCAEENCWLVNLSSGAYSVHLPRGSKARLIYLKSVIDENLRGANVKIDPRELSE